MPTLPIVSYHERYISECWVITDDIVAHIFVPGPQKRWFERAGVWVKTVRTRVGYNCAIRPLSSICLPQKGLSPRLRVRRRGNITESLALPWFALRGLQKPLWQPQSYVQYPPALWDILAGVI